MVNRNIPDSCFEADLAVFDGPDLLARVAGDRALAREVVGIYLESAPGSFAALKDALRGRDAQKLVHQAHALRGSSASVGARQVQASTERIETLGDVGAWDQLELLVEQVQRDLERFKALCFAPGVSGA